MCYNISYYPVKFFVSSKLIFVKMNIFNITKATEKRSVVGIHTDFISVINKRIIVYMHATYIDTNTRRT